MKGRPRKFTNSARATVSGTLIRQIDDAKWADFEKILGAGLPDDARQAMRAAAERYVISDHLEFASADRVALTGRQSGGRRKEATPLTKLADAMSRCVAAWHEADSGFSPSALALVDFADEAREQSKGAVNLFDALRQIETASHLLRIWTKRLNDEARPYAEPFDRLILELAEIAKAAGAKVTSHGAVYLKDVRKPPSMFQRFASEFCREVIGRPKRYSESAFHTAIARALGSRAKSRAGVTRKRA